MESAFYEGHQGSFLSGSSNFPVRVFFVHDCTVSWQQPIHVKLAFYKLHLNLKCTGAGVSLLLMLLLPLYFIS